MTLNEATKNWDNLSNFVYERVTGNNKDYISPEQYEKLDDEGYKVLNSTSVEDIVEKIRPLMGVNIMDKDVDFKFFENTPKIWSQYYKVSLSDVAEGYRAKFN